MDFVNTSPLRFTGAQKSEKQKHKLTNQQKRDKEVRWASQKLFDAQGDYVGAERGTRSWGTIVQKQISPANEDTFTPALTGTTKTLPLEADSSSYREKVEKEQARHQEQLQRRAEKDAQKKAEKVTQELKLKLKNHRTKAEKAWDFEGDGLFTPHRMNQVTTLTNGHTGTAEDHNLHLLGYRNARPGLHTQRSLESLHGHLQEGIEHGNALQASESTWMQQATSVKNKIASLLKPIPWPPR